MKKNTPKKQKGISKNSDSRSFRSAQKAYASAGVDVDLGNQVKSGLGKLLQSTHRTEVLSKVGHFGGLFDARFSKLKHPVLVSSIDGVGTKLRVAEMADKHDTIGEDLVNHCVNDIAVLGAEPLFFLDYVGMGKLETDVFQQIITGLARGCKKAGCALIGGETAQMPGLYQGKDYDLVGTIIGVVDKKNMIDGSKIRRGDVIVGFPSSGLHTNGYSLARKILFEKKKLKLSSTLPGTTSTLGQELLRVHVNYQPLLKKLQMKVALKGLAHITGGGLIDNLPRILPEGLSAKIILNSWKISPLFRYLTLGLDVRESYQVFNMGIGMAAVVSPADAPKIAKLTRAYTIGVIEKQGAGGERVELCYKK